MICDYCGTQFSGAEARERHQLEHRLSLCRDAISAKLAIVTKRAEATEAETAARMIAWLEGLEPDDMPDSATVLERLKRGDWRVVDICPTCRGVSGNGSGYCAAWHGGQHLDKTEVKP